MDLTGMKRRDLQALCKRRGLPAGGTNAALAARLADAAVLQAASGAGDEVVTKKGCLKRLSSGNDLREAKKVSFALEESRRRTRQSQVFCSPAIVAKTRGRSKATETRPARSSVEEAVGRGRGRQSRASAAAGSAVEDSVAAEGGVGALVRRSRRNSVCLGDIEAAEVGAGAPARRSRRNSVCLGDIEAAEAGVGAPVRRSRRNSICLGDTEAAEAGAGAPVRRSRRNSVCLGDVEPVLAGEPVDVDRKRKRKSLGKEEETAVSVQVGAPCRVTRRSSLSGAALLLPLPVEKKQGRRKATDAKNDLVAEAQVLAVAGSSAAVVSKRSVRKGADEPVVQNAKVEAPGRITRSRAVAVTVTEPIVLENKRRRTTENEQEAELPTVSEVPKNDAAVTRTQVLRNRVVQVNNSVVEGTHVGQELENKREPSRPATRQIQQLASSMEEEHQEQVPAPSNCPPLRRSRRNGLQPSIADSETNKSNILPMEASGAKGEDMEMQPTTKEPVRRLTRRSLTSTMVEKEDTDLVAGKGPEPGAHVTRAKRKSVVPVKSIQDVSEEFPNAKGDDVVKQPAVKEPARRSTRKSIVSAMHEGEDKDLIAEKGPEHETRVTRSKRKSVVPVENIHDVYEDFQNAKGDDVVKQPTVKEPARRSTRKSVVSVTLEEEDNNLIAEKSPEPHVRRSKRKSVVPVEDCKGDGNETRNAKDKDVVKQPAVTEPSRRSTRKSVISAMLEEKDRNMIAEKSTEAHFRTLKRKSVVPAINSKGYSGEAQNAKREDAAKQVAVKKPLRRSTCKSVASDDSACGISGTVLNQALHDPGTNKDVHLGSNLAATIGNPFDSTMSEQECYDIGTDDGLLSETRTEGLFQLSSITEVLQHNGIVSEDKTLRDGGEVNIGDKSIQIVNASSDDVCLETSNTSFSRSTTAVLIVDEAPIVDSTSLNSETKQSDAVLSCCDGITETVTAPQFDEQKDKDSQAVSTDEDHKESCPRNDRDTVVEVDYGSKPTACATPSGVECENVRSLEYDSQKMLDVGQGVAQEEFIALEQSNDERADVKFDLKMKSSCEAVDLYVESNCMVAGKNRQLVAESCDDEQAVIEVQQGATPERTLEKPSLCSEAAECKHECMLPKEAGLHSIRNKRCPSRSEESPLGLQSLPQEIVDDSMEHCALASATSHTEETTVSQPISLHDTHLLSEVNDCMYISPQNKGTKGLTEVSHEGELLSSRLSVFSVDANHSKEVINSMELTCKSEGKRSIFHSENLNTSVDVSDVNVSDDSACGISGTVLNRSLHDPGTNKDVHLGSNLAGTIGNPSFDSTMSEQECHDIGTDDGLLSETITEGLFQSSSITEVLQHNGIVTKEKTLRDGVEVNIDDKSIQIVNASSDDVGLETSNTLFSRSTTAVLIVDEAPAVGSTSLYSETKQSDAEVAPTVLSCCDGITETVTAPQFDGQNDKDSQAVSTDEEHKESCPRNDRDTVVELDYRSNTACTTPSAVECENVQPLGYDAQKTLDVGQGVAPEEIIALEQSNDERADVKFDLKIKSSCEAVGPYVESNCMVAEKNTQLVAESCDDEQAVIEVQQGATPERILEKPSLCSEAAECKHECMLPKEARLHSIRNKRSPSRSEESPIGLQSLPQEIVDDSMEHCALASATSHTEETTVSQPISLHDTHLLSEVNDCMYISPQNKGTKALSEVSPEGDLVSSRLSVFSVDANHCKEVINSMELTCKSEGKGIIFRSENLIASVGVSDVNVSDDSACGISGTVLNHSLHAPGTIKDVHLGSNLAGTIGNPSFDSTMSEQECYDIGTDDGLLSETRTEGLFQSSSITEVLQHNGIVTKDKTLRDGVEVNIDDKSIQIVNASSDDVGLETSNTSFSRSTAAVLIVDEAPVVESTSINSETKQSDAEVAPTVLSCCDGITETVTTPQFDGQKDKDSQAVSTDEEHKESCPRNDSDTIVEVDYGSKPTACASPSGVECENVQPLGYDAQKMLDVGQGVAQEEFIALEQSNDECVDVKFDLKIKSSYEAVGLYVESKCMLAEKNTQLVAESCDDEQTAIEVQQGATPERTLEKPSLCLEAAECKHEYMLPKEAGLHSIRNKRCPSRSEKSPLGLQSLSQEIGDDSMVHRALASATSHTEETTVSQPISLHDTLDASVDVSYVNVSDDSACGISGTVNRSLHAPGTNKDVRLGSNLAGTFGNPSFDSTMSGCKGSLFEEAVHKHKSFVGTCPPNPKELLLELQSMPLKENIEDSLMLESAKVVKSSPSNSTDTVVFEKFLFGNKSDSKMNTMNNYVATCSSDPKELIMELQSSSNETIGDLDPNDNFAFPNIVRNGGESTICHVENLTETVVSSDADVYLGPSQDFSRDEGKQDCMYISLHDDEGLCQSGGWMHIDEFNSELPSCDAEVLRQDHVEECHKVNEVTPTVFENDMSEAVPFERNIENMPAVEVNHPVEANSNESAAKDSSKPALQRFSGIPRDHL